MNEERATFRYTIGALAIVGGLVGMCGLFFVAIPEGNKEPLLLALGLVIGWGSTIIGYEFGSSPAGRKAADAGLAASAELASSTTRIAEQAATASVVTAPADAKEAADQVAAAAEAEADAIKGEELPEYAR